jgi:hypothetical protein
MVENEDPLYLDMFMKELKLGSVKKNQIILTTSEPINKWELLFLYYRTVEVGDPYDAELTWEYFKKKEYERTNSIRCENAYFLDPCIAYLVRTISLIGLHTWCSCDGHGVERSRIWFNSKYDSTWFWVLLKKIIRRRMRIESTIEIINNTCVFSHPKGDFLKLYQEMWEIAEFINKNFNKLRKLREIIVMLLDDDWMDVLNSDKLYDRFESQINFLRSILL